MCLHLTLFIRRNFWRVGWFWKRSQKLGSFENGKRIQSTILGEGARILKLFSFFFVFSSAPKNSPQFFRGGEESEIFQSDDFFPSRPKIQLKNSNIHIIFPFGVGILPCILNCTKRPLHSHHTKELTSNYRRTLIENKRKRNKKQKMKSWKLRKKRRTDD